MTGPEGEQPGSCPAAEGREETKAGQGTKAKAGRGRGPSWAPGPGPAAPGRAPPPHLLVGLVEEHAVHGVRLLEVHGPRAQRQVAAAGLRAAPRSPLALFSSSFSSRCSCSYRRRSRRLILGRPRRVAAHGGGHCPPGSRAAASCLHSPRAWRGALPA